MAKQLLQAEIFFIIPLQMKDLNAADILVFPQHSSLCTIYDGTAVY